MSKADTKNNNLTIVTRFFLGSLIITIIIFSAIKSHINFRNTLVNNLHDSQAMAVSNIRDLISSGLDEAEENLSHISFEIMKDENISQASNYLSTMHAFHPDDFHTISLLDENGEMIFISPQTTMLDSVKYRFEKNTINKFKDRSEAFISEKYTDGKGNFSIDIIVPFTLSNGTKFYAVGNILINSFFKKHITPLNSKKMCFILTDDDGEIFCLMNVDYENHDMISGNIFELADECLSCHQNDDFLDIKHAVTEQKVSNSVYQDPSNQYVNRTSIPYQVHNETWTLTICTSYENFQGEINNNVQSNVILSVLMLFTFGWLSYLIYSAKKKQAIIVAEAQNLRIIADSAERFRRSEEKFRTLFEDSHDALYISSPGGRLIDFNQAMVSLFGYKSDELISMDINNMYHNKVDREQLLLQIDADGYVKDQEIQLKKNDGSIIICLLTASQKTDAETNEVTYEGCLRDITKHKLAEKTLKESEERFKRLFEDLGDAVFVTLIGGLDDGQIIKVNPAALSQTGFEKREIIGMNIVHDLSVEGSGDADYDEFESKLLHGESVTFTEKKRKKDGHEYWVEIVITPIEYNGKKACISINRDISDRKQSELSLKKSKQNFVEAERISNTGSWDYDVASDTASWSDNMFQIFDVDPAMPTELIFTHFVENLVHPDDRENVLSVFQDALVGKQEYNLEYRIVKRDGDLRDIHALAKTLRDENGKATKMIGKVEDITDRKRAERERSLLEEQLYQSQKMETIGTLAGGITHEINQPLNAISISANSILYWQQNNPSKLPDIFIEELQQISKGAKRIDEIIRHMRSFWVSDNAPEKKLNSLSEVVVEALSLMEQQSSAHGITIEKKFSKKEINILSEKVNLEQIIINLMINAMHSLDESGRKNKKIIIQTGHKNALSYLSISDNGIGLPEGKETMIFSPFYSTKDPDNNMGLGLAIVKNMVDKMDAIISATNNSSDGAKFTIIFPNNGSPAS